MRWRREDAGYAVATTAAAAFVTYLVVANFGLVPSPFSPEGTGGGHAFGVPTVGAFLAAAPEPSKAPPPATKEPSGTGGPTSAPTEAPASPTPPGSSPTAAPPKPPPDTSKPAVRFTTPDGAVIGATDPVTINGTAQDTGSGVASVDVTFDPSSGDPTTVHAQLTCDQARASCLWKAEAPDVAGDYSVNARATDRAGNVGVALPISVTIVNGGTATDPLTEILEQVPLLGGLI